MLGRPHGLTRQWLSFIDANIGLSVSLPSALGFVFVGAHELHSINRNILLFDGLLYTPLVFPESLRARVATSVPLQELLGEPAVKALVVLPLQVRAGLSDAVHIRKRLWKTTRKQNLRRSLHYLPDEEQGKGQHAGSVTLLESRDSIGWFESAVKVAASWRIRDSVKCAEIKLMIRQQTQINEYM